MNVGRFTKFTLVLTIVALIAGLSACDQLEQLLVTTPPEVHIRVEIPIGVVVDETGANSTGYGIPMRKGFELARDHINDSGLLGDAKLKLIVKDDQSSRETTVAVVDELIAAGVSVITGFAVSSQLEEVTQTAQDSGVVLFSSVSSAPVLAGRGNFTFRSGLNSGVLNPPLVKATHEKFSYQMAATIHLDGDTYSELSDKAFRDALVENGVQVVTTEAYPAADYEAAVTRIAELNPDVLFISTLTGDIPGIMKQARELMPSVHLIVPELTDIEVAAGAGEASEGVVTSIGWRITDEPMNQAFIQSYTETYGEPPVAWAAQSYATLNILAAAIVQAYAATHSIDATAIQAALAHTMDFPTILGNFSFNEVGDAVYDPILLTVENGEFVAFE